ncbi:hypothetical protein GCM10009554_42980 [Kribbella koreensis]|uniref:Uncharacterized protein n=2 Tax=Kribbella koreensis TaxID=57909 RepID=A0ABP4B6Y6_9ACTN
MVPMATFDWGVSDEPAAPTGEPLPVEAADLPEVTELQSEGWALAPEEPMWVFLPAIWPGTHRAWVADRSTRWVENSRDGVVLDRAPWPADLYEEIESDVNALLAEAGVPPRPAGRLWLLKPPPVLTSVQDVIDQVIELALAAGSELVPSCNPEFVRHAQRTVQELFGR